MNNKIVMLLFFISSTLGMAQEQWTLSDCVNTGKENSLKLMVAALETNVSIREKQSIASYYLPNIGVNGVQSYNFGSTIDPMTNSRVTSNISSMNLSVDAGVTLFDYGNFLQHQRDKLAVNFAELNADEVLFYYQSAILDLFYEVVGSQAFLEIQQQQLVNSKANLDRVQKEVEAGAKPKSDLYDIDFIFHTETINIQQTQNSLANQKLRLLQLLNVENTSVDDFILVYEPELVPPNMDYAFNPTVEKERLKYKMLEQDRRLISAQRLPRVVGNYQYGSFYSKPFDTDIALRVNSFSKQMGDNKSQYVSLGLSLPVFRGGSIRRQLRVKNEELKLNQLRLKQSEVDLANEISLLEVEVMQLTNIADFLKSSIEKAERSFSTTQAKYENGKVDIFSFNAAKNQVLTSQYALIQNVYKRSFMDKKRQLYNTNSL